MLDITAKSANYELSWFAKRYNALLIDFPENITSYTCANDDVCAVYDSEDAYEALKSAHVFLNDIANKLIERPADENKLNFIDAVFSKIDLIWALGLYGSLCFADNEYYLSFDKSSLKTGNKTLPESYGASFMNILDNGCCAEYFKAGKSVKNFKSCDRGFLYFNGRLTALGIYLFIKKLIQKRWYWDEDIAGGYSKGDFIPAVHCAEPYYRIDMRIFTCGERLKFDIFEQLAGYSVEFINYFKIIYNFVRDKYPQCLPEQGFWKYISCSVGFKIDVKHRMLGQLGVGGDENSIGFFTCLSGKEMIPFMERIDEFNQKVIGNHLLNPEMDYPDLKHAKEITYRSRKYIFRDITGIEIRFPITCRVDADQVIKIMELKAGSNKNTI